jgi:osmotically-inducible protein OsmY
MDESSGRNVLVSAKDEIIKQVRAAFQHEPRINLHRFPIFIDFSDGVVTLEGKVENVAAKKIGLRLAAGMRGVRGIVDRLLVAPAVGMSDGEIRDHVRRALIQEPTLQACTIRGPVGEQDTSFREPGPGGLIDIAVKDGVVTLNGAVTSLSHQRLAGMLAWWVPGSRDVINGLEVVPPEEDNDDEVTEAVRAVLEKDRFVTADHIRVSTRNRVVTLQGLVSSEKERQMAEWDAWYLLAVDLVVNALKVHR